MQLAIEAGIRLAYTAAEILAECIKKAICYQKPEPFLESLPKTIILSESAHTRCAIVNGSSTASIPHPEIQNLLRQPMLEETAVIRVLEKRLVSVLKLLAKQ